MERVFLSFGSNTGDKLSNLRRALERVKELPRTNIKSVSSVYETEPVGMTNQPTFFNLAAEVATSLPADEFFDQLKSIEKSIGRTATVRWGPREIDIDIIFFGSFVFEKGNLRIPHPERLNRKFVLEPLVEIAGDFVDPIEEWPLETLLIRCTDGHGVKKTTIDLDKG